MTKKISESCRNTPYNDLYQTCERTAAKLCIYPGSSLVQDLSAKLGLEATIASNSGQKIITRLGRERIAPRTVWIYSSEKFVNSKDLRVHLDWLLEVIEPRIECLAEESSQPDTRLFVSCVWWSANGNGGPTLWPNQMLRLSTLGLELNFEVQFHGSDDD